MTLAIQRLENQMSGATQSARISISEAIDEISARLHQHLNRITNVRHDVLGQEEECCAPSPIPPTSLDGRVFDLLGIISSIESEFASVVMRLGVDIPKHKLASVDSRGLDRTHDVNALMTKGRTY
jgi:hypothetical protein